MGRIRNQNANLAFSTNDIKRARCQAAIYTRDTLNAYLQGKEKFYAVEDVLEELEDLFGTAAFQAVKLIRDGKQHENEDMRYSMFVKAIDLIDRAIRQDYVSD